MSTKRSHAVRSGEARKRSSKLGGVVNIDACCD
jgi:hypothetical protein